MAVDTQDRWTQIRKIHDDWANGYRILGGLVLVLIGIWLGSLLFAQQQGYDMNLYTEIMGVVVTVAIVDTFNRRRDELREEWRREHDLKARLVREAGSRVPGVAMRAVEELRNHRWLTGRDDEQLLKGAYLEFANLLRVDLAEANLAETFLARANLEGANLGGADLTGAFLDGANLEGAELVDANLAGAFLERANFSAAFLSGANLEGAELADATFDDETVLPDTDFDFETGEQTYSYFRPRVTDMHKYTDPDHPDFWKSPIARR